MAYRLVWEAKGRELERPLPAAGLTIGREPDNDLVLADPSVSRHHARLEWNGRSFQVRDLGSVNGVRVNDAVIGRGPADARPLGDGDLLQLGNLTLRLVREDGDQVTLTDESVRDVTTLSSVTDFASLVQAQQARAARPQDAAETLARSTRMLKLLASVSRSIVATEPQEQVLESIVELVFESMPAERAAILLWDDTVSQLVPKVVRNRDPSRAPELRIPSSVVRRAFAERCVVQTSAAPIENLSASMHRLGVGSAVAVPLGDETRAIGVIYGDSPIYGPVLDGFSAELLSALANHAAIAIEQGRLMRRLQQEERARMKLCRYLPRGVVDDILAAGDASSGLGLKAQSAHVTVLFCDMTNFTARSEGLEPEEVMLLVNRHFGMMTEVIFEHEGTVDKYIGDCVMAVFGAPRPQPDHARRAARTALGLREAVKRRGEGEAKIGIRIGMNSGRVVAGDVGHVLRREWTVLGSAVNLASRMESSVAKEGQIVMTGETHAQLGDEFETRRIELAQRPKGISRDLTAWELLGAR